MKIQFRYRSMALAALAISLLAIAGFPQTSSAGAAANANNARAEMAAEKKAAAPGQEKKDAADETVWPAANNEDNSAGPTTHGSENGPGGQVCDGDPDNEPGDGGNYENTCDSYPDPNNQGSDNGAGDGQATGKPCEGCVGNADDKNPAGQAPSGPEDHNNGYECDQRGRSHKEGNNGIGFGNPAHTGCEGEPEEPGCVPTADQNPDCSPKCVPTSTQDAQCNEVCQPTAANNQCKPCPDGSAMPSNGCKCPDGSTMPANGKCDTCPAGQTMGTNGKCECPSGQVMANGACTTPCVAGQDAACSQVSPTCVESATERCGGVASAAVASEQLGRLDVLGVSLENPQGAVAPAALARTGGFQLTALVQAGIVLAMVGLGLTVLGRRRRQTVDIAGRIGD